MSGSRDGAPALSGAAAFVHQVFERWRGGLAVALFVAGVLTARFTLFGGGVYESRVILELAHAPPEGASAAEHSTHPEAEPSLAQPGANQPAAAKRGELSQRVRTALPELASPERRGDVQSFALDEANGRLLLACRASQPHTAHQRCAQLVTRALRKLRELRIVQSATLPSRPLPAATSTRVLIVFASAWLGLTSGVLWMVGLALLPLSRTSARPSSTQAARAGRAGTQKPNAAIGAAPSSARVLTISQPDDEREAAQSDSRSNVRGRATRDPREPDRLIPLDMGGAWQMDPALSHSERPADLLRLCNQLYVAAAQHCFVVGVSSEPGERVLKSRMAAQLAFLLSRSEHARVLLLELDFEFPSVDRVMRVEVAPRAGFSQQVHTRLKDGELSPWTVVRCTPHLSVLCEGRVRTPGTLHAHPIGAALDSLRAHFDIIVADGPTCDIEVDKRALSEVVDGVVFVASASTSDAQAVALATQRFRRRQLLAVVAMEEPT